MATENRFLSLGAGVQSSTLLLLSEKGELPPLTAAVFADTGWEPAAVYRHLDRLAELTDIPIVRVSIGNLRDKVMAGESWSGHQFFDIPAFTAKGPVVRQCTTNYKVKPIRRYVRGVIGPKGKAEQWIGISTDEIHRMKTNDVKYLVNRWPLIELRMNRGDCLAWWERHYPGIVPPKSACLGCPYHNNRLWIDLYKAGGKEWDETVAVDERLREKDYPGGQTLDHPAYLHRSLRPLGEVIPALAAEGDLQGNLDLFGEECEGHCGV